MNTQLFKKFIIRLMVLGLMVALFFFYQWALPPFQYSFRAWEGYTLEHGIGEYPFIPSQSATLAEVGDLSPYTDSAILKMNSWHTDLNGFRNDEPLCQNPEIVVLGDSASVGAELDQTDTVQNQLKQSGGGRCVISLAGGNPSQPLSWLDRLQFKPKVVLVVLAEWDFNELTRILDAHQPIHSFLVDSALAKILNLRKLAYWNFRLKHGFWVALRRTFIPFSEAAKEYAPTGGRGGGGGGSGQLLNPELLHGPTQASESELKNWIHTAAQLAAQVKEKYGAKLVVTLVPNKASIYLGDREAHQNDFHSRLIAQLSRAESQPLGFQFIDLFEDFRKGIQKTKRSITSRTTRIGMLKECACLCLDFGVSMSNLESGISKTPCASQKE